MPKKRRLPLATPFSFFLKKTGEFENYREKFTMMKLTEKTSYV